MIQFAHADGDLDLELFDPDGNQLAVSSGREDSEQLAAIKKKYGFLET